jgi:hypothetical protein
MDIKNRNSPVRAYLHLTPQGKANKTLVYFNMRRHPVSIDDRGDVICVNWRAKPSEIVRVDVTRTAAEVEIVMERFLETRPSEH